LPRQRRDGAHGAPLFRSAPDWLRVRCGAPLCAAARNWFLPAEPLCQVGATAIEALPPAVREACTAQIAEQVAVACANGAESYEGLVQALLAGSDSLGDSRLGADLPALLAQGLHVRPRHDCGLDGSREANSRTCCSCQPDRSPWPCRGWATTHRKGGWWRRSGGACSE
jgi:hypothetical protein